MNILLSSELAASRCRRSRYLQTNECRDEYKTLSFVAFSIEYVPLHIFEDISGVFQQRRNVQIYIDKMFDCNIKLYNLFAFWLSSFLQVGIPNYKGAQSTSVAVCWWSIVKILRKKAKNCPIGEKKSGSVNPFYLLLFLADFAAFHPIVVGAVFWEEILGGSNQ